MSKPATTLTSDQIANLPYRPCVGIMLVNAQGKIFAGQRIDSDVAAWQMPQGGIDPGEDARAAAQRELWEETGVTSDLVMVDAETSDWVNYELPAHLIPKLWKGRFRGQKQRWFLMRFLGADDQIKIDTDHPEFSEWKWLDPSEVVDKIVPFKRGVYTAVLAAFEEHLK